MAKDSSGKDVQFGDYVMVLTPPPGHEELDGTIVRIVRLTETAKGVKAIGAFVDLVGNGRIAKVPVDIAAGTLVMRSDGTGV